MKLKFRNLRYIIYSSTELLDALLATILFLLGLFILFPSRHIDPVTGAVFDMLGGVKSWGLFFAIVGFAQLLKILWQKKPHWIWTEIIKHSTNFSFSLIALSLAVKYPFSPHSMTYATLAVAAFFSATRFERRQ